MWDNFLPLQISGSPDYVVLTYDNTSGVGSFPLIQPDPSGYNAFDEVVIMLSQSPTNGQSPTSIIIDIQLTPMPNANNYYGLTDGILPRTIILGPDGFWRFKG